MQKQNGDRFTIKNEKDLKAVAEQDRFYSIAISPLTVFIVVYAVASVFFYVNGELLGGIFAALPAVLAMALTWGVHYVLFWSRFGPNWKLYYTCSINGTRYYIVRDGARRYRVYQVEGETAYGVSTPNESDRTFVEWLKHERPQFGKLATS